MSVELVTGHTGTPHVTSAHAGALNAGIVGRGAYILGVGARMAARMVDANTVVIDNGSCLVQGRQVSVGAAGEALAVRNGTQGMKRHDIVAVRYERDPSSGLESATLKVIEGTPDASSPSDPACESGSIESGDLVAEEPLYRIVVDGLGVSTPVPLASELVPIGESMPVTGTGTMNDGWTAGAFRLTRHGPMVFMEANVSYRAESVLKGVYGSVPEPFRPAADTPNMPASFASASAYAQGFCRVGADGGLYLYCTTPVKDVLVNGFWRAG